MKVKFMNKVLAGALLISSSFIANAGLITFDIRTDIAAASLDIKDATGEITYIDGTDTYTFMFGNEKGAIDKVSLGETITFSDMKFNGVATTFNIQSILFSANTFTTITDADDDKGRITDASDTKTTITTNKVVGNTYTGSNSLSLFQSIKAAKGDGFTISSINFEVEEPTDVPEPTTFALFGLALMGLAGRRFGK